MSEEPILNVDFEYLIFKTLFFLDDFKSAVKIMTHVGEVYEPDQKNHRLYDALYHDVYKKMYKRLKPLYERIREITGYPK